MSVWEGGCSKTLARLPPPLPSPDAPCKHLLPPTHSLLFPFYTHYHYWVSPIPLPPLPLGQPTYSHCLFPDPQVTTDQSQTGSREAFRHPLPTSHTSTGIPRAEEDKGMGGGLKGELMGQMLQTLLGFPLLLSAGFQPLTWLT